MGFDQFGSALLAAFVAVAIVCGLAGAAIVGLAWLVSAVL